MNFSQNYLDKMLHSAITYYNLNTQDTTSIPLTFENEHSAIDIFTKSLQYEAYQSLKNSIKPPDNPILYAVNLNTNEPGIVTQINDTISTLMVHTKYTINKSEIKKNIKPLSKKDLDISANKVFQKIQKHKEKLLIKKKERDQKKLLENEFKNNKKLKRKGTHLINTHNKHIEKLTKQTNKINNKLEQLSKNPQTNNDQIQTLTATLENKQLDIDTTNNKIIEKQTELNIIDNNINNYHQMITKQKQDRKKKQLATKKPATKKSSVNNPKKQKNIPLNKIQYHEFDDNLLGGNTITDTNNKELDIKSAVLYPSPVPHERHITALGKCNPNPVLLGSLLYGDAKYGNEFIKIYHGPPGTGKTWRLMKELSNILELSNREKILICAPTNIGVINLYNRAKDFGIHGCLILSINNCPAGFKMPEKQGKNNIVFTTISMRHGRILNNLEFDTIIIDEAAQCKESWIWGLLRHRVTKLLMAGDPQQLPSLVSSDGEKLNYGRSMMERLMDLNFPSEFLNIQRRMHPDIVKFPNEQFYNNQLTTVYSGNYNINAFEIIDIKGIETKVGNSYKNEIEANTIIQLVDKLKLIFSDIVIIVPYKAQYKYLKKLNNNLDIHTIDSFQGKEADAIILSTVRSGSNIGFWKDYRRLNVGLTRAKHVLRIIGNTNTWKSVEGPLKILANSVTHLSVSTG